MFDSSRYEPLLIAVATVRKHVRAADPSTVEPTRAEELVGVFAEIERLGAAGKALYAKRVADSGRWQQSGERSAADWLARQTGVSVGTARGALDTAEKLASAPATDEAFRNGHLSAPQAEAIASAAAADPAEEQRLLDTAKTQPLQKLRDECARVKAAASDMVARHREIHRRRFFRSWNDADGARCGMFKMTPEAAAEIERAIKPFANAAFDAARRAGVRESSEAYAADGVVAMARASRGQTCETKQKRPEAIVLVNIESLQRDAVEPGETCEIPGVGPVSVSVARDLLGDSLLRIVIRDGVDIVTTVHAGRLANDAQRLAIQVRQHGLCARPTCHRRIAEVDHITGFVVTGATPLDELGGLCRFDHNAKTHHGHTYTSGARGWEWRRPDGVVEHERPPP